MVIVSCLLNLQSDDLEIIEFLQCIVTLIISVWKKVGICWAVHH
ncbi:hypothetical protein PUR_07940 [Paenibacillus sp. URB8-2]|nr:hypothetical protein PUR_07940 [Paenibacillus sp. URB8-2]